MNTMVANILIAITLLVSSTKSHPRSEYPQDFDNNLIKAVAIDYIFNDSINFTAQLDNNVISDIQEIYIFIQPEHQDTVLKTISPPFDNNIVYHYDLSNEYIKPFSKINYWYHFIFSNGEERKSALYNFDYDDNRFEWKNINQDNIFVFWYSGDLNFGQTALNTAFSGIQHALNYLPTDSQTSIKIYIYENASTLQETLHKEHLPWIGGHTNSENNVILVSIPPGPEQKLEFERQIPHEIMHVFLFQYAGSSSSNIPLWLSEGMATLTEITPNPSYKQAFDEAIENDSLLPMNSLCHSFPENSTDSLVAYAQSASFVEYLYDKYGVSGITLLLKQYIDGKGCTEGVVDAFDTHLYQLERQWQDEKLDNNSYLFNRNISSLFWSFVLLAFILSIIILLTTVYILRKRTKKDMQ